MLTNIFELNKLNRNQITFWWLLSEDSFDVRFPEAFALISLAAF